MESRETNSECRTPLITTKKQTQTQGKAKDQDTGS